MPKISFFLRWLCLVAVAVSLASCADSPANPGIRAYENNKKLADLKPDRTTEEVTKLMGPPDKIETYRGKNNEAILTYWYITKGLDEYTNRGWNKDNFTPFIFVDDRLSGWGWNQLDTAAQRYEFVIRPFQAPGR
jgi:Protein of unknown function (DUF3192)